MQDPYITALNSQKASLAWIETLSENMSNMYTPGYREAKSNFSNFINDALQSSFHKFIIGIQVLTGYSFSSKNIINNWPHIKKFRHKY